MTSWNYFKKTNYLLLIVAVLVIGLALVVMSLDKHPYGYGLAGLTIGPLLLALGFGLPFFAIFYDTGKQKNADETFEHWVNFFGWLVGIICFGLYTYTAEPTTSFWDCGEFIAAAYKLQIPHPPGAPLFLLCGRLFSLLAPSKEWIAFSVNMVSVTASAFTCLVLYASIVLLLKKSHNIKTIKDKGMAMLCILAAATGSLAFAFSDSFWFNATEAEVYAFSCLFTALAFWGILKWESEAENTDASRWLLFIAYTTGLSTGVHLLNLLTLPALAFVVFFKKFPFTWKGAIITALAGLAMIAVSTEIIIVGLPSLAGATEIFCVNALSLPFYSGIVLFSLGVPGAIVLTVWYARKKKLALLHMAGLCLALVLTGYLSYLIVLVRSSYNTPLDENDPGDVMSLLLYLKRDQYGSRPLLKGPYFTAGYPEQVIEGAPRYRMDVVQKKYIVYDHDYQYKYNPKHTTLFPRMHNTEPRNAEGYRNWSGLKAGKKPGMKDNLKFLFNYQLGHQYWRYFMWNFAGRISDRQNAGWLTPLLWFNAKTPTMLQQNRARNNYFLLPLLLGIAGMWFHLKKNRKDAYLVLLVFLFSGVAIVLYLNQPPIEPRERDYTFVGSFYAFSIWIGFGVFAIYYGIKKWNKSTYVNIGVTACLALAIPAILISQNWDDHNRTGRYFAEDSARNVLSACGDQGILFTAADNDTFPLWFLQEAKEYRTDVRICNLSLLNMDWYIQSMKLKCNNSLPLPMTLEYKDYIKGKNEHLYFYENPQLTKGIDLQVYLRLLQQRHSLVTKLQEAGQELSILPSNIIFLLTNKKENAKILNTGLQSFAVEKLKFNIPDGLSKSALIVLDIIQANQWKRPIYFNYSATQDFPFLKPYLQKEGFVYRLLPVEIPGQEGWIDEKIMYKNLMKQAQWRGLSNAAVCHDPAGIPFIAQCRMEFYSLAEYLNKLGAKEKSKQVLLRGLNTFPDHTAPYDFTLLQYIGLFMQLGEKQRAMAICGILGSRSCEFLAFYCNQKNESDKEMHLYTLYELSNILSKAGQESEALEYRKKFEQYYQ